MTYIKKLHLATTMTELENLTQLADVKSKKLNILLETARKLLQQADKNYHDCDEELAYVFYSKYFRLLESIHQKPEYADNKNLVRLKLGDNDANKRTMEKLEILHNSLLKRYNRLKNSFTGTTFSVSGSDDDNLSTSDKFDEVKNETTKETLPKQHISENSLAQLNSITCKNLYECIQNSSALILDCRSKDDYEYSKLAYNWSFNVPEEIIVAGMSAGKLQDKLSSHSKVLWASRSVKEKVVLIDWNSKDANPPTASPISILKDILLNWDPDVVYRSPIKILEGGYEYFIMMYPTFCTNPSVQAPQNKSDDLNMIDDIEYPSIYDITMKDEIRDRRYNSREALSGTALVPNTMRPSVDRSSKLIAMKTYDQQKPFHEFAKEYKDLIEKAQVNDARLEQASEKWHTITELKRKSADDQELSPAEQHVLYDFMQLESTAEDYKIENKRLRDELEQYKLEKVRDTIQEQLSPNEKENIQETIKQIEFKIEEREKVDERHELEKIRRDEELEIARKAKRQKQIPVNKPLQNIPEFDRSNKPQTSAQFADRRRDFSPVPGAMGCGLTGLRNLGNTCYMNSIIQCLSNTPQLNEYCVSGKYKGFLCRKSRTKGHIVEEVAALIKVLWEGTYKYVASKDLRYVIGQYENMFSGMEQQDSHEFLTILMDWLHSDLQTIPAPEKPRDKMSASENAWLQFTKSRESHILHLFYGQIKSTVKCAHCSKESATYESFSNLSLELPRNDDHCHLGECLQLYFSGELINGWNCPNCKKTRDAVKKLDISKLPPVLVIHLKRFYADDSFGGSSYKKKQNYVRFPLDCLNMKPYIAKSELRTHTPKSYYLYGVSNHYGSMESGHYTAFCKNGVYDRWYKFDDQVVSQMESLSAVSSAGYILFYTWLPTVDFKIEAK